MNVIVCIKQVPAITDVKFDLETGTLIRKGVESEVNPFDMYALEEAIQLKEHYGGTVTVLSMGPSSAERSLRHALALGCDKAFLLCDKKFAGADTLATSYTLKCAIEKIGKYDIIICGHKTTDGDTGQVGPGLAEWLGIPHVSYVRRIVEVCKDFVLVERTLDNSYEELETSLPCLITVTKEINEPRLPSFKNRMKSRKVKIINWSYDDLGGEGWFGLEGSATRVIKVFSPPPRGKGELLQGDVNNQVKQIIAKLKERHVL